MKIIKLFLLFVLICNCSAQDKINGISFVAKPHKLKQDHVNPVLNIGANYAAIMPFGFIRSLSHPNVQYNSERQWFGETKQGVKQYTELLKSNTIKIMLKPQLWVMKGEYTGDIVMQSEEDWKKLEETYKLFILDYAKLAQSLSIDLFCIGTELKLFVENRPKYWEQLIAEIKTIYKGKLTYAANWDEFKQTPFWDTLDFIGIDAYFPLNGTQTPKVDECVKAWQAHKKVIKSYSEKYNKPILFTEYGYRSTDYNVKEPWQVDYSITSVNMESQKNALKALYETFWKENWFAGGFLWKWFPDYSNSGGENDNRFTPQNKPSENIVKAYYSK